MYYVKNERQGLWDISGDIFMW